MHPVVRVTDVWKYYDGDGSRTAALRGVSLDVAAGELVAVYGKSGSGKTTLLNLLAGLDRVSQGTITIEGRNIEALGESGRTLLRRIRIGFVFQFFNLLPTLTALENVRLSLELAALVAAQEFDARYSTGIMYWEGAVAGQGRSGAGQVRCEGYVELTGYAGSLGGIF